MSNGGTSPRNEQEIVEFTNKEKKAQDLMDRFYSSRGHTIETREGNRKRDLVLNRGGKTRERIEEKFRFNSLGKDFLIEIFQDLVSGNLGWFLKTDCDYLHYILCHDDAVPYRLYRIKWKNGFRDWFCEYLAQRKQLPAVISARGYGLSINLSCIWGAIPEDLVTTMDIPQEVIDPDQDEF